MGGCNSGEVGTHHHFCKVHSLLVTGSLPTAKAGGRSSPIRGQILYHFRWSSQLSSTERFFPFRPLCSEKTSPYSAAARKFKPRSPVVREDVTGTNQLRMRLQQLRLDIEGWIHSGDHLNEGCNSGAGYLQCKEVQGVLARCSPRAPFTYSVNGGNFL